MTYKEVSRAIIYDDNRRILLAKRGRGNGQGQWALIGGKPENEENPSEAIIREVLEESGLIFAPKLFKEEVSDTHDPRGDTWRVAYFSGKATGKLSLRPEENTEAKFFTLNELESLDIAFGHLRIIKEFLEI
ncbi:MAG TPA: NUDIX hydrolase [Candidatus Saccharimonadales bacterium]|nr:NUDIX hydrolase [Candidatus Saccharimonadales bacterium]